MSTLGVILHWYDVSAWSVNCQLHCVVGLLEHVCVYEWDLCEFHLNCLMGYIVSVPSCYRNQICVFCVPNILWNWHTSFVDVFIVVWCFICTASSDAAQLNFAYFISLSSTVIICQLCVTSDAIVAVGTW